MNEKKLRMAWIGTLIGAFVLIVAMVLVWKFRFYDQVVSQLASTKSAYTGAKGTADKLAPTLKLALLAEQRLDLSSGELQYFRTRYRSLPFDLTEGPISGQGPRRATFVRYLLEYSQNFGIEARRQLIRAADESGVQINTNIKVDAPPQNPEDIISPNSGFLKPQNEPLGVTVTGTLPSILNFFQIINRSEILMTVGTVKIEGVSPNITASFNITPYLLVSGPSAKVGPIPNIDAALPGGGANAAAGGAGGAGGAGAEGGAAVGGEPAPGASPAPGGGGPSPGASPAGGGF